LWQSTGARTHNRSDLALHHRSAHRRPVAIQASLGLSSGVSVAQLTIGGGFPILMDRWSCGNGHRNKWSFLITASSRKSSENTASCRKVEMSFLFS
jgi:hypothetical protein